MLNGAGLLNLLTYKFWEGFHVGKYTMHWASGFTKQNKQTNRKKKKNTTRWFNVTLLFARQVFFIQLLFLGPFSWVAHSYDLFQISQIGFALSFQHLLGIHIRWLSSTLKSCQSFMEIIFSELSFLINNHVHTITTSWKQVVL